MAYFNWGPDLEIDQGPIDEDHRALVDFVNELHTATSEGRGADVVGEMLANLVSQTEDHVRREEAAMAAAQFPDLENHKIGHDHFINQLKDLCAQYESGKLTVAAQLSVVLRDWLSLHIRRSDKELLFFKRKSGKYFEGKRNANVTGTTPKLPLRRR